SVDRHRRCAAPRSARAEQTCPGPSRESFREFLGRYSQSLTRWFLHARDRHTVTMLRNPIYTTPGDSPWRHHMWRARPLPAWVNFGATNGLWWQAQDGVGGSVGVVELP